MIKSIKIQGFQSHLNTTIEFAPHLTVITGATDSGKTAIIRAVRWLAFGEPGGESFVNDTVGQALVEVTMENGVIVSKSRKNNKTVHSIIMGNDTQSWESAAAPEEVTKQIGIIKQTFGDIEAALNFAYQLEAPFLISLPASAGAKVLGKIAGTEVVDLAVKDVAKDTYAARQEISQANKAIEKTDAQLGQYADLEALKTVADACATLLTRYDENVARKEKLDHGKRVAAANQQQIETYERKLQKLNELVEAAEALKQAELMEKRSAECKRLRNMHNDGERAMEQKQRILLQLRDVELANQSIGVIEEAIERLDTMSHLKEVLRKLNEQISAAKLSIGKIMDLDVPEKMIPEILKQADRIQRLQEMSLRQRRIEKHIADHDHVLSITANCFAAQASLQELEINQQRLLELSRLRSLSAFREGQLTASLTQEQAASETLAAKQKEVDELWAVLDVCPLCEQAIVKGDKHHGC